ncbi:FGGY family carbohydrate kinase [Microbacterium jejuense]|uniref:FGGY family carbohydrate kinase n=1 Tax=Microbacterium jejuense TaxID=1263637 RepID=UPI001C6E7A32|nr:FGGY family carbohydrate kinase [Microbacterium jejuense]
MTLVLGLDIGSTSTKAALVEVADEVAVVRLARTTTPATVGDLVDAAAALARECLGDAAESVAAVGIASMAESGAALGADGHPLTPLLRWDRRVDPRHLDDLLSRHPDLPSQTGVPATTKPAAVALRSLRAESPGLFDAMRHWSGVADLVAHALTGVRATDHTLAARTMMAGAQGSAWDAAVLSTVGIRTSMLPELRPPGAAVGVTSPGARAFGLGPGVPVYIAGHDHAVGAWASGVRTPGAVADSLGTAEAIVRVTDAADTGAAVAQGFSIGRTVDGAAATVIGGSRACGAMLEWWAAAHPGDDLLTTLAALPDDAWTPSPVTVLPYPSGRQCPRPDPAANVVESGAARDGKDRVRAVLEGLVFHARWMRETADLLAGSAATDLTVLGSLAQRVPSWAPLAAAAGTTTFTTACAEAVAAGAALLAAVRAGAASDQLSLARDHVVPASAPDLDHAYRRFLDTALEGAS